MPLSVGARLVDYMYFDADLLCKQYQVADQVAAADWTVEHLSRRACWPMHTYRGLTSLCIPVRLLPLEWRLWQADWAAQNALL